MHVVIIMLILSCTQSPQPGRGVGVGVASVGAHALQIKSHTFSSCRLFLNCLKRPHKPLISLCEPPMGKCGYDPVVGLVSQVSKLVSQFTFFRKRLVTLMSIVILHVDINKDHVNLPNYDARWHKSCTWKAEKHQKLIAVWPVWNDWLQIHVLYMIIKTLFLWNEKKGRTTLNYNCDVKAKRNLRYLLMAEK